MSIFSSIETIFTVLNTNKEFFVFLLLINSLFLYFFEKISSYINITDKPDNIRKFEKNNTPLLGGVLIFINITILTLYTVVYYSDNSINTLFKNFRELYSFYITSAFIFMIGVYDDKYSLKPNTKFIYLSIILLTALLIDNNLSLEVLKVDFLSRSIPLYDVSIFFTLFCLLLFINALNMFDGINLQVGIYVLLLLLFFLLNKILVFLCLCLLLPIFIFLILNYKGKSYLGDNGSLLLAYILGYICIKSYNQNIISDIDTIFVIMMIPGLDMLRLFISRIMQGKNAFHPDLNHIHHIFQKLYGSKSVVIIQLLISIPAFTYLFVYKSIFTIIIGVLIYLIMIYFVKLKIVN